MPRQPLSTDQEKILYAASLYGIKDSLQLLEDKITCSCDLMKSSSSDNKLKVISFKKVN